MKLEQTLKEKQRTARRILTKCIYFSDKQYVTEDCHSCDGYASFPCYKPQGRRV